MVMLLLAHLTVVYRAELFIGIWHTPPLNMTSPLLHNLRSLDILRSPGTSFSSMLAYDKLKTSLLIMNFAWYIALIT